MALEQARLVRLSTYHGKRGIILLPRLRVENVGLVSIYNTGGAAYIQFWRSVFECRAPKSLATIEAMTTIKRRNTSRTVSDQLLEKLTRAYKEAAGGTIEIEVF